MRPEGNLRLRALLDRWLRPLIVLVLLLGAVGGWVVFDTFVQPTTTTEERVASTWETTGSFDHEATVQRANPVYPVGRTLSDRPIYFATVTPRLDGSFDFLYVASDGGSVDVDVALVLRIRAVSEDGTETYWTVTEPVQAASYRAVGPGREIRVPFSIDVNETVARLDRIHRGLGARPGESVLEVVATTRLRGTVNGESVDDEHQYNLTIQADDSTYAVEGAAPTTVARQEVERSTEPVRHGPIRRVGGPLFLLVSLFGLVGLALGARLGTFSLSEAERERLDFDDDRAEYDDWITTGSVPGRLLEGPTVEVWSLEGLVDLAIDTNNRVIELPSRDRYVLIGDDVVYVYEPPVRSGGGES